MTGVHAEGSPDDPDDPGITGYDDARQPCGADTVDGTPCRRPSLAGVRFCEVHLPEDGFTDR